MNPGCTSLAAAELTDRGVAFNADHPGGLLPQLARHLVETVVVAIVAVHMPPIRAGAFVAPKAFNPLIGERQHTAIGLKQFISASLAEPAHHQLAHIGDVKVMLLRNAEDLLIGMEWAEQLAPPGAAARLGARNHGKRRISSIEGMAERRGFAIGLSRD
jgi:hypothetical protein